METKIGVLAVLVAVGLVLAAAAPVRAQCEGGGTASFLPVDPKAKGDRLFGTMVFSYGPCGETTGVSCPPEDTCGTGLVADEFFIRVEDHKVLKAFSGRFDPASPFCWENVNSYVQPLTDFVKAYVVPAFFPDSTPQATVALKSTDQFTQTFTLPKFVIFDFVMAVKK